VAPFNVAHIGDDKARTLVGKRANENDQNYRNEREKATLRRTGKTKTQAELSLGVVARNVGPGDPLPVIGDFRASVSGSMLEGLFLALSRVCSCQ
jgi:hypothetical protein